MIKASSMASFRSWKIHGLYVCPGPMPPLHQAQIPATHWCSSHPPGKPDQRTVQGSPFSMHTWVAECCWLLSISGHAKNCHSTHPAEPLVQPLTPLLIFLSTPLSPVSSSPWDISPSVFPG